mmetsp:Transcript_49602/g.89125  ORF Transcript_49602/g.89125 Transcript_49602/m.89125 type:complete len:223 (+) Transcript_49602:160-828(+)
MAICRNAAELLLAGRPACPPVALSGLTVVNLWLAHRMVSSTNITHALCKSPSAAQLILTFFLCMVTLLWRAFLRGQHTRRHVKRDWMAEEQLRSRDPLAKALMHLLARIVRFVIVVVSANAILSRDWPHGDHEIHEVGPPVCLNDDARRQGNMHNAMGKRRHGRVDEHSICSILQFRSSAGILSKSVQDGSSITSDLAIVFHWSNLNLATIDERTTDNKSSQ